MVPMGARYLTVRQQGPESRCRSGNLLFKVVLEMVFEITAFVVVGAAHVAGGWT